MNRSCIFPPSTNYVVRFIPCFSLVRVWIRQHSGIKIIFMPFSYPSFCNKVLGVHLGRKIPRCPWIITWFGWLITTFRSWISIAFNDIYLISIINIAIVQPKCIERRNTRSFYTALCIHGVTYFGLRMYSCRLEPLRTVFVQCSLYIKFAIYNARVFTTHWNRGVPIIPKRIEPLFVVPFIELIRHSFDLYPLHIFWGFIYYRNKRGHIRV